MSLIENKKHKIVWQLKCYEQRAIKIKCGISHHGVQCTLKKGRRKKWQA